MGQCSDSKILEDEFMNDTHDEIEEGLLYKDLSVARQNLIDIKIILSEIDLPIDQRTILNDPKILNSMRDAAAGNFDELELDKVFLIAEAQTRGIDINNPGKFIKRHATIYNELASMGQKIEIDESGRRTQAGRLVKGSRSREE